MHRKLTQENIRFSIEEYLFEISQIGSNLPDLRGIPLLQVLKRGETGIGPYKKVSLFEAANRIMTDLVILRGVEWLLHSQQFPFESYQVEYGNEDQYDHDISASFEGQQLIGEAFNVARSFFQGKKAKMLKKMRDSETKEATRLILANLDSVSDSYKPKLGPREAMLLVDVYGAASPKFWYENR